MKIAVIYVSKTGVTEDVVKRLKEKREDLELFNLSEVKHIDISNYDFIVLGSGIRMGMLLSKMTKFCKKNAELLSQKLFGFFMCGADSNANPIEVLERTIPEQLVKQATFTLHCGGEFRFDRLGKLSKMIIKMVSKQKEKAGDKDPVALNQENILALIEKVNAL